MMVCFFLRLSYIARGESFEHSILQVKMADESDVFFFPPWDMQFFGKNLGNWMDNLFG